jgi:hypothetical protein
MMQVLSSQSMTVDEMRRAPWYASLYLKRTDKTRQRDLRGLRDAIMLWIDSKARLMPGFIKTDSELQLPD